MLGSRKAINRILIATPLVLILFFLGILYFNSLTSVTYNGTASANERFVEVEETEGLTSDTLLDDDEVERKSSLQRSVVTLPENLTDQERAKILEEIGSDGLDDGNTLQTDEQTAKKILEIVDNNEVIIEEDTVFTISAQEIPWGVSQIGADKTWSQVSAEDKVVAVIDTGISLQHEDLASNVTFGFDFVNDDRDPSDDNGHGTHVAGIISAVNNNIGVVGVSHQTKIMPIKVLDGSGSGFLSDVVQGINYAVSQNVDVINMSIGSPRDSATLKRAIDRAEDAGILVVASAGNEANDQCSFPARYDNVVCVGATTPRNRSASYSNRNPDIVAPGSGINSTFLNNQYSTLSGTSMSAPFVSGTLALGKVACPNCTTSQLVRYLTTTSVDLGDPGRDYLFGNGLVDAANFVSTALEDQFTSQSNSSSQSSRRSSTPSRSSESSIESGLGESPTDNSTENGQTRNSTDTVPRSQDSQSRTPSTLRPAPDNTLRSDNSSNSDNDRTIIPDTSTPLSILHDISIQFEGNQNDIEESINTATGNSRITLRGSADVEFVLRIDPPISEGQFDRFIWFIDGNEFGSSKETETRTKFEFDTFTSNQYTLKIMAIYTDGSYDIESIVLDLTKLQINSNGADSSNTSVVKDPTTGSSSNTNSSSNWFFNFRD
jgi:subtilisin family serine protease